MSSYPHHADWLQAILPAQATPVRVQDDGIALSQLGGLLIAVWDRTDEQLMLATYLLDGGSSCKHQWVGPCTFAGAQDAFNALSSEGLHLRPPQRSSPALSPLEEILADLFGDV